MKKLIIYLSVCLLIFALVAFGITYFSINGINWFDSTAPIVTIIDDILHGTEKGIDLNSTYDTNDLLIEHSVTFRNDVEVQIPKITGLNDISTQDLINNDIVSRAMELLDKYPNVHYSNYYTYANFANVISISFYVGDDNGGECIYLNYNLVDGSRLKLEDLFVKDADILSIVRTGVYESMALYNYDYSVELMSVDEMDLYKLVKNYMDNEDKAFAFTPASIYLYFGDYSATVKMIDIPSDIVIYSKYMTDKSIFTGEYPGYKDIFTCADSSQFDIFDTIEFGYIGDNMWYDFTSGEAFIDEDSLSKEKLSKFEEFEDNIYSEFHAIIDEYSAIAQNNPDTFYILLIKPNINIYQRSRYFDGEWEYSYSDMATVYNNIQLFEMPMDYYNNVYKDRIAETYRYEYFAMRGGAWFDVEGTNDITISQEDEEMLYNYVSNTPLTEVYDVFDLSSDYMDVIKTTVRESLSKVGVSNINELLNTVEIKIEGTKVVATIPSIKDFAEYIYFDSFDKNCFKHFN